MVNISLRDSETHFDQRPSHRPVSKAVRDALEYAHQCAVDFNDLINKMYTPGTPHPAWTEIARLADRANEAEKELRETRLAALNECSCGHDPNREDATCPVCIASNADSRERYGIPFEGSGL